MGVVFRFAPWLLGVERGPVRAAAQANLPKRIQL